MGSRSDSIKDPIYYPSMQEAATTIEASGTGTGTAMETTSVTEGSQRSRGSAGSQDLGLEETNSLKVPRKFITNWRQACDRTRDRTKDLLKRWRTAPSNVDEVIVDAPILNKQLDHPGWSVHVWTTWVSRFPSDDNLGPGGGSGGNLKDLAPIQRDKFGHMFAYLLDHDKDGFVNRKDFRMLSERLRRFADWSWNGPEYLRLMEAEQGLAELILQEKRYEPEDGRGISLDEWLRWWARVVAPAGGTSYNDIPFWLKILPRIFFLAINGSASGIISKKELGSFYGSVVGLDMNRIAKCLDIAYNSMTSVNFSNHSYYCCYMSIRVSCIAYWLILCTRYDGTKKNEEETLTGKRTWRAPVRFILFPSQNGDYPLGWPQYQLVFANFLFGRGPFGPGEHFIGMTDSCIIRGNNVPFPIDYAAMNTPKDKLEVYSPHCRSARRSVVV
ncbi:uncharacterized protein LOC143217298 isoform X1 [Lasioglossum baleicum]|uniref:uncharacterized protein LOC143217298 isoform X1 n=1 Tax=Lasioglossum baleicum TaxID=434251 RepID=UPI003FCC845F